VNPGKKKKGEKQEERTIGVGVDLPLLLIFSGAIGGLIAFGIIGLFIGPVVLAVVHSLIAAWVVEGEREPAPGSGDPSWENDENGEITASWFRAKRPGPQTGAPFGLSLKPNPWPLATCG
jgi:hypothetical protein